MTVHLKRFSPMGRKIGHPVRYDEQLSLQPCMSEGEFGPTYSLYGVISHAGGGPNSGHYYAHVKGANGQWYEMNDDSVMRQVGAPTSLKNAYILFYIREKGQVLEAALNVSTSTSVQPPAKSRLVANMKKRKIVQSDDEEERPSAAKTPKRFIGPLLPTASPQNSEKDGKQADPQAEALKKKIAVAKSQSGKSALMDLSEYNDDDDDDDDDVGEKVTQKERKQDKKDAAPSADTSTETASKAPEPSPPPEPSARPSSPVASSSSSSPPNPPPPPTTASSSFGPSGIPPSSFYGTPAPKPKDKKRKTPDGEEEERSYSRWAKTPISPPSKERRFSAANPFNKLKGSNNLQQRRDSAGSSPAMRGRKQRRHFMM